MHRFAFLLKTYGGDLPYVERLLASFARHNIAKLPLYIVAPAADQALFKRFVQPGITLLADEAVTDALVRDDGVRGIRPGYVNQQIVKLAFWQQRLCENYLCLDSDGEFIRDFDRSDFMFDEATPYTILVEDAELAVEPEYYAAYWRERATLIRAIQAAVGLTDKRMLTCHGFAILSATVLESLFVDYMQPRGLAYRDLLQIAPYEYSWYNMWLQKQRPIPIEVREPLFKYFHHQNQHVEYLHKGVTRGDIARGYVGIVINSNYSRHYGLISYEDGEGLYDLPWREIGALLGRAGRALVRKVALKLRGYRR